MFLEMKDGAVNVRRILEVSPVFGGKFFVTFDTGRTKVFVFENDDEAERERGKLLGALQRVEQASLQ
jgi:hypothetical protein